MIAGYPMQSPGAGQRQVLQPGQWPGFRGPGGPGGPVPNPVPPGVNFHSPPFAQPPVPGFAHPSFSTQPMAQPVRHQRPESRVQRPEVRETVRDARASRPTNLSATYVRLQQEFQALEVPKDEKMPLHFEHKLEPYAYLERRLQWIQEDLQRQQTRLVEESVPKQASHDQQDVSCMVGLLHRMQLERRGREELENKISSLESTLMKERAQHNLSLQQMRQKHEQALSQSRSRFEMQMKSNNEQLLKQSQRLEQKLKEVFQGVENRLSNRSFTKGHWVPIPLEEGETTTPSWSAINGGRDRSPPGPPASFAPFGKSGPLFQPRSKGTSGSGGSMRVGKGYISPGSASPGHDEMPNISQKALSEMLQRLHQENQELQRVNHELSQQKSRKGSKEASKNHSPILTPGGGPGMYPQWQHYRPAG